VSSGKAWRNEWFASLAFDIFGMRVAILTPTFSRFSGIDIAARDQAVELSERGADVTLVALAADMEPPANVNVEVVGMPGHLLWQRMYRLLIFLDIIKMLNCTRRLKDCDLVVSHQYPMNWLAYLTKRRYGVRYLYYNHGITPPSVFPSLWQRCYMRVFNALSNWTSGRADAAISISEYARQQLREATGIESELRYRTADEAKFHKGVEGRQIRVEHGLGDAPVILYVGRLSPHKGVHLLLQAFQLVRDRMPSARLVIVGKRTFSKYAKQLDRMSDSAVVFAGYVPDEALPSYYAACDVYATATLWEGFDLPVAEAQACGKPVVAFDIGPHREVVDERGILVRNGDVPAFAVAISGLLRRSRSNEIGLATRIADLPEGN